MHLELGDAARTKASLVQFDTASGKTLIEDLNKESRIKWDANKFTILRIGSLVQKNMHVPSHEISYELMPLRMGCGRYNGVGEEFTLHDFWLTKPRPNELRPKDLDQYENGEAFDDSGIVVWYSTPVLHRARDEDFGVNGTNSYEGVAITSWAECDLRPRDFFASTPLYKP